MAEMIHLSILNYRQEHSSGQGKENGVGTRPRRAHRTRTEGTGSKHSWFVCVFSVHCLIQYIISFHAFQFLFYVISVDHLERVAIKVAKGLVDGSVKAKPRKKGFQEKVMDIGFVRYGKNNCSGLKHLLNSTSGKPSNFARF